MKTPCSLLTSHKLTIPYSRTNLEFKQLHFEWINRFTITAIVPIMTLSETFD